MTTKTCNRCNQIKPTTDFYTRKGGTPVSECKDCMKERSKQGSHTPPTTPRVESEILAIDYLRSKGIHALPGKAVSFLFCDIVAWGAVGIEVKYSTPAYSYNTLQYTFDTTPRQRERGFIGHLIMLICDPKTAPPTFHLFRNNDPVFYISRNGEPPRLKSAFTYFDGREQALKHGNNRVVMTDAMMLQAQDRVTLITDVMHEISRNLMHK